MKLWINTIVWGAQYIDNFFSYALPSILAPNNLHALTKHIEVEYTIFTRDEDIPRIRDSSVFAQLTKTVSGSIQRIGGIPDFYCSHGPGVQGAVKPPIVDTIRERQGAVMFCSPDEVWANGSFDYIGKSLASGNTAIMTPGYRITTETFVKDLFINQETSAITIDPLDMQKALLKHMHPHVAASHYKGFSCPVHPEYIVWPVSNEGVIFYHLIRTQDSPGVYVPHLTRLNKTGTLAHENDGLSFDLAPASNVLCASLTSVNWMVNWLHEGKPHDPLDHAKFVHWYHDLDWDLMKPVRIQATDEITLELWRSEEEAAQRYFDEVRRYRDELRAGRIAAGHPRHSPSSCGKSLSPNDIAMSQKVLQWVLPVINGRFPQETLELLNAKNMADGW